MIQINFVITFSYSIHSISIWINKSIGNCLEWNEIIFFFFFWLKRQKSLFCHVKIISDSRYIMIMMYRHQYASERIFFIKCVQLTNHSHIELYSFTRDDCVLQQKKKVKKITINTKTPFSCIGWSNCANFFSIFSFLWAISYAFIVNTQNKYAPSSFRMKCGWKLEELVFGVFMLFMFIVPD